jgi:hypothetical protein
MLCDAVWVPGWTLFFPTPAFHHLPSLPLVSFALIISRIRHIYFNCTYICVREIVKIHEGAKGVQGMSSVAPKHSKARCPNKGFTKIVQHVPTWCTESCRAKVSNRSYQTKNNQKQPRPSQTFPNTNSSRNSSFRLSLSGCLAGQSQLI